MASLINDPLSISTDGHFALNSLGQNQSGGRIRTVKKISTVKTVRKVCKH